MDWFTDLFLEHKQLYHLSDAHTHCKPAAPVLSDYNIRFDSCRISVIGTRINNCSFHIIQDTYFKQDCWCLLILKKEKEIN